LLAECYLDDSSLDGIASKVYDTGEGFSGGDNSGNTANDDSSLEPQIANLDDKFSNDKNIDSGRDKAAAGCPSCNFVSWFMLDEMPGFLSQFEDDESYEDTLQFVKDSYKKFHLFLGHKA
jgi:hypothetical protein